MGLTAIYPGSFDPVTFGHLDVLKRATSIFSEVVVAVARNTHKKPLFSIDERLDMLRETVRDFDAVRVESFDGLVIDYAQKHGIHVLIRGLRMISDFEYEFQMALTNRRLAPRVETVFLMPSEGYSFHSSSMIKEAVSLGGDISSFVPKYVETKLKDKLCETT